MPRGRKRARRKQESTAFLSKFHGEKDVVSGKTEDAGVNSEDTLQDLVKAITDGNVKEVERILQSGRATANCLLPGYYDNSCGENLLEIANVDLACLAGKADIIRCLLEYGALASQEYLPYGERFPITYQINTDSEEVAALIRLLIEHGLDVQHIKATGGGPLLHELNAKKQLRDPEFLTFLVEHGADITQRDCRQRTLLHCTASYEHTEYHCDVLAMILDRTPRKDVNALDSEGKTPLMRHVHLLKCPNCIGKLLDKGADVNTCSSSGEFPVHSYLRYMLVHTRCNLRIFRKMLRRTNKRRLRENPFKAPWSPLGEIIASKRVDFLQAILETGFDLLDFAGPDVIHCGLLGDVATYAAGFPEPFETACIRVLVACGLLSHPQVYEHVIHICIDAGFLLRLVHHGLNIPGTVASLCRLTELTVDESFSSPAEPYCYEQNKKCAVNILRILALLRIMGVIDDDCVRIRMAKVLERNSAVEVREHADLTKKVIGKPDDLKSLCRTKIRSELYELHGQMNLLPLVESLSLPSQLIQFLLFDYREMYDLVTA